MGRMPGAFEPSDMSRAYLKQKAGTHMERRKTLKGIIIMLTASLLTCLGQLCWKLAAERGLLLVVGGFLLYGCGALLMIVALKYGELSVLHPMLSAGYVLSLLLGALVLHEGVTGMKIAGVAVIILGLILISSSGKGEKV